jgi:hypothetical protein
MAGEHENKVLAKIAPVEGLLRFSIEQLETMQPCLRRRFDLFVVRVQLSLPRPLSERVGKVELRKRGHYGHARGRARHASRTSGSGKVVVDVYIRLHSKFRCPLR